MRNPAWSMACPRRQLIVDLPFVWSGWMQWQTLCRHRACRIVDGALAPVLVKTARPRCPARTSFHITDSLCSDIEILQASVEQQVFGRQVLHTGRRGLWSSLHL